MTRVFIFSVVFNFALGLLIFYKKNSRTHPFTEIQKQSILSLSKNLLPIKGMELFEVKRRMNLYSYFEEVLNEPITKIEAATQTINAFLEE